MLVIISNIIIAIMGLLMVKPANALVEILAKEEKVTINGIKENLKFNCGIGLSLPLLLIALFYKFSFSAMFFIYAFLGIMLIIDAFVDMKAQIIPNELNFIGFLVGIVLAYIALVNDVTLGLDKIYGLFAGGGIFLLIALVAFVIYKNILHSAAKIHNKIQFPGHILV